MTLCITCTGCSYRTPRGYHSLAQIPVLRGNEHCPHCFCSPRVIVAPPDFLMGSASPHPANAEKRHRLYQKFWRTLKDLGVWRDEEYLQRKERRTARDDLRDNANVHYTCK